MTLAVCFNADGPYWDNTVRVPAYPTGVSYSRPFRYRDAWVSPALLEQLADPKTEDFSGRNAILACRFGRRKDIWLPLREVTITHIDEAPDTHSVFFRLGAFIESESTSEETWFTPLPSDVPTEQLFFDTEADLSVLPRVPIDQEDRAWVSFADAVADNPLPFADAARRSLFVRVQSPAEGDKRTGTGLVHRSFQAGPNYGFVLKEGSSYEFTYLHRIPSLIGTETATSPLRIQYESETGNLELDRSREEITGRYQPHYFAVTARRPTGTSEQLVLSSEVSTDSSGPKIETFDLPIPLRVKKDYWYRARTSWIFLIALFIAFVAYSGLALYTNRASQSNPQPVTLGNYVAIAIGSGLVSFFIWFLQQKGPRS